MNIGWNQETWYSRLSSVIFLLGIFPAFVFYLGMRYEEVTAQYERESAAAAAPLPASVSENTRSSGIPSAYQLTGESGAPYGWQAYRNASFGYEISYPETWHSSGDIANGAGTYLFVETQASEESADPIAGVRVFAQPIADQDLAPADQLYVTDPRMKLIKKAVTAEGVPLQIYLGKNPAGQTVYIAAAVQSAITYLLAANVSDDFYQKEKGTLESVATSFRFFPPRP